MDRRLFKRSTYPEAQLKVRTKGFRKGIWGRQPVHTLLNLSRFGLAFRSSAKMQRGQTLTVRIEFPDGKALPVKGRVLWLKENSGSGQLDIGLQFLAFGSSQGYNRPWVLEILRKLTIAPVNHN